MNAALQKKPVSKITLPQKNILGITDLAPDDIASILDLAQHYAVQNRRKSQTGALLKGLVLVNLFLENSTRTRMSFEMAARRLGADVINMTADGSSMRKGESYIDTLKTINAMLPDILVVRAAEEGSADTAARIMSCPVINGGDGTGEHPTQALLDALTLHRHFGRLSGLNVAICGDIRHSRVAHSNLRLLGKMGVNLRFTGPIALLPHDLPGRTPDMLEALQDADAVIVLRIQKERLEKSLSIDEAEYFRNYGLTAEKLKVAKKDAVVLHPGPMNRGVEIDGALADDPARSLITTQVELGVAARMACLDLLTRSSRK